VVCDAPAGTPGHTSSHGCTKCLQVGRKIDGTLTYSTVASELITDEDFANRIYPNHYSKDYLNSPSAFETHGVRMITQVPLDCMHLIELGVVRKFLERIYYNKVINKVSKQNQNSISAKLMSSELLYLGNLQGSRGHC